MTSVVDRLVLQVTKLHDCEEELQREKTLLQNKISLKETLEKDLEKAQTRLKSMEKVRASLEKGYQEAIEEHAEVQKNNVEERKQIAENLRVAIGKVTAMSEEVKLLEEKALHENRSLNEQLQAYASCHATGQSKYAEIMSVRDAELTKIEAAQAAAEPLILRLEAELDGETAALARELEEREDLKRKADEWMEQSNNIYDDLQKTKSFLERSKGEQERLQRRIVSLENDKITLLAKAEKVKKECENERKKAEELEEKVAACRMQTEKMLIVKTMLENSERDS